MRTLTLSTPLPARTILAANGYLSRYSGATLTTYKVSLDLYFRWLARYGVDPGIPMRDMQIAARHEDPRTTARYDRGAQNLDRSAIHILSASIAGAS